MASRICQQPNGKFCRFSEIVDNFTHYEMDFDQAVEECREHMGRLDAIAKVERGIDGGKRFKEGLRIVRDIHGRAAALQAWLLITKLVPENEAKAMAAKVFPNDKPLWRIREDELDEEASK